MSTHVDVTWYGCPICHLIWPDDRLCCELSEEDPPDSELEWLMFTGATLTEWRDLPDDNPGGFHPGITRFSCELAPFADQLDVQGPMDHGLRRAAWLVEFDDDRVDPMHICYECASVLFGVSVS